MSFRVEQPKNGEKPREREREREKEAWATRSWNQRSHVDSNIETIESELCCAAENFQRGPGRIVSSRIKSPRSPGSPVVLRLSALILMRVLSNLSRPIYDVIKYVTSASFTIPRRRLVIIIGPLPFPSSAGAAR